LFIQLLLNQRQEKQKMLSVSGRIKEQAENNRHYLVELIRDAVRISSYSGEAEEIQRFLQGKLDELGLETRLIKVDPVRLEQYKGFSYDGFSYDRRFSLVGVKRGSGRAGTGERPAGDAAGGRGEEGKSLILNGHVDVVPPGDLSCWNDDPLSGKFEQGKVYGRGSLDMKGGLAVGITVLKVLADLGFENYGDIIYTAVCGEETGGCGAFALVEDGLSADGCIILEPTRLKICPIQSGCHTFKITIRGRSVHACMAYKGINVIDKFYIIYEALKEMDRRRHQRFSGDYIRYYEVPMNVAPLNIGTITAGEWPSSVPDRLEACGRAGIFPGETVEEMHREFEEAVRAAATGDPWLAENQPEVEWYEGLFEPAATDLESDLVRTLAESHLAMLEREVQYEAVTYGSDMRIFNLYAGIPTVMYGPGDVSLAHTVNEHIEIDRAIEAVCSVALMIVNWCGGHY
jgi:acetylornithine deacetylase